MEDSKIDLLAPVCLIDDDDDEYRDDHVEEENYCQVDADAVSNPEQSAYLEKMIREVHAYIKDFFADKEMWYGGPVPAKSITTEKYIGLVLLTPLENAIDMIHEAWPARDIHACGLAKLSTHQRALHLMKVQKWCKDAGIPKEWSGGITVMYYEFCEGFKFVYDH